VAVSKSITVILLNLDRQKSKWLFFWNRACSAVICENPLCGCHLFGRYSDISQAGHCEQSVFETLYLRLCNQMNAKLM